MKFLPPLSGTLAVIALIGLGSPGQAFSQSDSIKVTLLGTGAPAPDPGRFGPATLVEAGAEKLLFDVGRGATIRLNQISLPMREITAVFITHFHSDHLNGLGDLWMTGWLPPNFGRRTEPLRIWGPVGLSRITAGLEETYAADIAIRIVDEQRPAEAARFEVTEFSANGVVFESNGVTVTAFEVNHGEIIKPAYGYRIDYAGRSVVISGDTRFDENVIAAAEGADLIIHEVAAFHESLVDVNPAMQNILDHHTTPEQAGIVFDRVQPKLAVYSHIVRPPIPGVPVISIEELLRQTHVQYDGPLVAGEDLMSFEVGDVVTVSTDAQP